MLALKGLRTGTIKIKILLNSSETVSVTNGQSRFKLTFN